MRYILYTILTVIIITSGTYAYDFDNGRQMGMAGGLKFSSPNATDLLSCPIVSNEKGLALFEAGYIRKYELSELDRVYAAASYRYNDISFSFGISQFGETNYYVEQIFKLTVSYRYDIFSFGLLSSAKLLDIGSDERKVSLSAMAVGLVAGVNYEKYHLGMTLDNLNGPSLDDSRDKENVLFNVFAEIEGPSLFSIVGKMTMEQDQKTMLSIGQYFNLPGNNGLYFGIQSNPMSYGGGIDISYAGFGIGYSVTHHPVLGFSHNIGISYLTGGKTEE